MILSLYLLGLIFQCTAMYAVNRAEPKNACQTENCKKSAKRILDYMDASVQPCVDFYHHSCGRFLSSPGLRDDEEYDAISQLTIEIQDQLEAIMRAPIEPNELRSYQVMKNFTALCMRHDSEDEREVAHRKWLVEMTGGWPVLDNWNSEDWNLLYTAVALRQLGLEANSLFTIHVAADALDPSRALLHIDQPKLHLSRHKSKCLKAAVLMGADPEAADNQLNDAILFEQKLAKIIATEEDRRMHQSLYNPHTVTQLKDRFGWLDWSLLLSSAWPSHTEDTPIIIQSVDYLRDLGKLLQSHSPRVIANYLMWNAVFSLTYLERRQNLKLHHKKMPVNGQDSRDCLSYIYSFPTMTLVLNSAYARKYWRTNKESYKGIKEMVDNIAHNMASNIAQLDWMDAQTKSDALLKISKMKKAIGYPEEFEDDNKIEELYAGFTLDAEHFTRAKMDLWLWERNKSASILQDMMDKDDWRFLGLLCTSVDAHYSPTMNAMAVPAGIIQWPFYSPDVPAALNYGSIGMIIGHEMSHGFDNRGSQYDADGKLRNWWNNATKEQFDQRKNCFIDQYDSYLDDVTALHVNGTLTQGENIADNGGARLAYRSLAADLGTTDPPLPGLEYRNLAAELGTTEPALPVRSLAVKFGTPAPGLPGLEQYTSDQLFFLGIANIWCTRVGREVMKDKLVRDPHSPPQFRVNGASSNLKAFTKAFQCDSDTPMNRKKKCELW